MPTLSVRLLGDFSVTIDGETLLGVSSLRLQSLLAYLLLHRDASVSRHHLAFLFWPDTSEAQAHSNLRKLLHELRTLLPHADTLLLADSHTVSWNPDAPLTLELDVEMFERAVESAGTTHELQRAVDLYQGDLLPGHYHEWIVEARERLGQEYQRALERLAEMLERQGDYRRAIAYARRQLQGDPLDEASYRRLMRLSALSGNRAQVAWFYRMCSTVLQRELGVAPSAETEEAYTRCLELAGQSVPVTVGSPASPAGVTPNNLPLQLTSLVGRGREREEVERLVRAHRLLTLTGPPGVGKTRLAIQVAADLLGEFGGGAWFAELAPLHEPGLIVPTIARLFGLSEKGGSPIFETLKGYLLEKKVLLALDNFEHIVEGAGEIGELLASCPQLRVLVTSRVPLRLSGEHEYPVHPLSVPAWEHPERREHIERALLPLRGEDLAEVGRYEAIRLFVERAQAVLPSFELNKDNAVAVAEICIRLDGLPLAIELAAPRIRMFSPSALLGRLEHSLQLLTGGARNQPHRHRALRSAIEWSYGLLSEGEQQLFRRMAIFNGGRTLEALEAVCNFDGKLQVNVLDGVEALIEQSLLEQREGRNCEPRFWMLETIHEYATEKFEESQEEQELRRKHAEYFLALAQDIEPRLQEGKEAIWFDRLEEELDNFRAALGWLEKNDLASGLKLAGALSSLWLQHNYGTEGLRWLETLLASTNATEQEEKVEGAEGEATCDRAAIVTRARALSSAARLSARLFSEHWVARVRRYSEESLRLYRRAGDKPGMAEELAELAKCALTESDHATARELLEEAASYLDGQGASRAEARALARVSERLADVAEFQGDLAGARTYYEKSIEIARRIEDRVMLGDFLVLLGEHMIAQGEYAQAGSLLEEALCLSREFGDPWSIAFGLSDLSDAKLGQGDFAGARSLLEEAQALLGQVKDKSLEWTRTALLTMLGNVARAEGDYDEAYGYLEESVALARSAETKYFLRSAHLAFALRGLGHTLKHQGANAAAHECLREALVLYEDQKSWWRVWNVCQCLVGLGGVAGRRGELERAVQLFGAAWTALDRMGVQLEAVETIEYEQDAQYVRVRLDDATWERAWQEGRAMSIEDAVRYALERMPAHV